MSLCITEADEYYPIPHMQTENILRLNAFYFQIQNSQIIHLYLHIQQKAISHVEHFPKLIIKTVHIHRHNATKCHFLLNTQHPFLPRPCFSPVHLSLTGSSLCQHRARSSFSPHTYSFLVILCRACVKMDGGGVKSCAI